MSDDVLVYNNKNKEYTIQKGCPWYEAQQTYGPANVNWCEPTSCSLINEPANAWSNLAYILAAVIMFKKITEQGTYLRDFAWAMIAVGVTSFIYHSTNNFFTQFFDFIGMYCFSSISLALGTRRLKGTIEGYRSWFWFYMFINTVIFWWFYMEDIAIQKTFMLNIVFIAGLELYNLMKEKMIKQSGFMLLGIIFIALAQVFSILDIKRIWCEPENLFLHGHALWHTFGGVSTFFIFLHYKRIVNFYQKKN